MKQNKFRKTGLVVALAGVVSILLLYLVKELNQPMYVSTSFGGGYIGGWSEETLDMLNFFMGLGVFDVVIGIILMVLPSKEGD